MEPLQEISDRVSNMLLEAVPAEHRRRQIGASSSLRDLGLDSLAVANIVFQFADAHGVDFDRISEDLDMSGLHTVGDVVRLARDMYCRGRPS